MADEHVSVTLLTARRTPIIEFFSRNNVRGTRLDGMYMVPRQSIQSSLDLFRRSLTLELPSSFSDKKETYTMYEESDTYFSVPRMYGIHQFGAPDDDARTEGAALRPSVEIDLETLRPWQKRALPYVLTCLKTAPLHSGIVQAGCGMGKTCLAIMAIRGVNRKTVVLTHRSNIMDQWVRSVNKFAPELTVGVVKGDQCEEADVRVVMIQTLVTGRYDRQCFSDVGFVVVDECHHLVARTFQHAMRYLNAKYVMGLSATLERSDGNEKGVMWLIGQPIVSAQRLKPSDNLHAECSRSVDVRLVSVRPPPTTKQYKHLKNPNLVYTYQLRDLCQRGDRVNIIADVALEEMQKRRYVLVIAARKDLLSSIQRALLPKMTSKHDVCIYVGESSKKRIQERNEALEKALIILTTQAMAAEGFDHPIIDTVILATPVGVQSGTLEQAVGRCLRDHPRKGNQNNQVIDIVDEIGSFLGRARGREAWYGRQGYSVTRERR